MNIDISTYRRRIGSFGPGRGFGGYKCNTDYQPNSNCGSVIHYQAFLICLLLTSTLCTSEILVKYLLSTATVTEELCFVNQEHHLSIIGDCYINKCRYLCGETLWFQQSYSSYSSIKLLLSSDIEMNPGPISDKDEILNAIYTTSSELKSDIKTVKSDICIIKSEMESMRLTCTELKNKTRNIEVKQTILEKRLDNAVSEIKYARENREMMQLDIDAVQHIVDVNADCVNSVEDRFEKMELKSKKSNMRIFGLNEMLNENDEGLLKENIIEKVLKVACPSTNWSENNLVEAFRIGEASPDQPKITIVKFAEFTDKVKMFKSRDILRESGIRISDDLTDKQRLKLFELKKKGK